MPISKNYRYRFYFSDGHFRSGNFYRFYFSERQLRRCNKLQVTGFIPQNLIGNHFGQHSMRCCACCVCFMCFKMSRATHRLHTAKKKKTCHNTPQNTKTYHSVPQKPHTYLTRTNHNQSQHTTNNTQHTSPIPPHSGMSCFPNVVPTCESQAHVF